MSSPLPILTWTNRALERAPPVTLDPDEIEHFVLRKTGAPRIAGEHWRPFYRILAEDLERHAALTSLGRVIANGQLVGLLTARVRVAGLLDRHPEIGAERIERPIIIMGPMRSGSTRIQRLLACDPRLVCTRLHESLFPVPRGRGDWRRVAAAAAVYRLLRSLNPAIQRIHPSGPLQADEEFGHLAFPMTSAQAAVQWRVPGLVRAERARDWGPAVAELAMLLRLNGWARGGVGTRRWVLKCPAYGDMADALFDAFPDASVVHLSRDPVKVVPSSASLVLEQRRIHSNDVDPQEIGREWLERTLRRHRNQQTARHRHPQIPALDLHYDEVSSDWRGALHRLYRFLGLPLTATVMRRMERYTAGAKAHEGHCYSPEDFGLDEAEVRRAFGSSPEPAPGRISTSSSSSIDAKTSALSFAGLGRPQTMS